MDINSVFGLLQQHGLGLILLFMVGYLILQIKTLTDRMDKHEHQCDKWRDRVSDTIDKIKDEVTEIKSRLSRIEAKQE